MDVGPGPPSRLRRRDRAPPARLVGVGGGEPEAVAVVGWSAQQGGAIPRAGSVQLAGDASELLYHITQEEIWLKGPYGQVVLPRVNGGAAGSELASGSLEATLPGVVLAVDAAPGDRVNAGQALLRIESMKMEIEVTAPIDGEVAAILVAPGEHVQRGQLLATLAEPDKNSGGGR